MPHPIMATVCSTGHQPNSTTERPCRPRSCRLAVLVTAGTREVADKAPSAIRSYTIARRLTMEIQHRPQRKSHEREVAHAETCRIGRCRPNRPTPPDRQLGGRNVNRNLCLRAAINAIARALPQQQMSGPRRIRSKAPSDSLIATGAVPNRTGASRNRSRMSAAGASAAVQARRSPTTSANPGRSTPSLFSVRTR